MNISISLNKNFQKILESSDEKLLKLEGIHKTQLDFIKNMKRSDFSIDENANVDNEIKSNLMLSENEVLKPIKKITNYNKLYSKIEMDYDTDTANRCLQAIIDGDLYFHDATLIDTHYCYAVSTQYIIDNGLSFSSQLKSKPPRKLHSYIDICKEFAVYISNFQSGALALGDFLVNFIQYFQDDYDELSSKILKVIENEDDFLEKSKEDKEVYNLINGLQSFVHTINQKLRYTFQSPFINISIYDRPTLLHLFSGLLDNPKKIEFVINLQKLFCIWFEKGDPLENNAPYRFPVVTLNIKINENKKILDEDMFDFYSNINVKKGCFNIYVSEGEKIASCCRLLNDISSIDNFGNGGINIGSLRVCTINFVSMFKKKGFLSEKIYHYVQLCSIILLTQREMVKENIKKGKLNLFSNGVINMNRLFSTIGVIGVYEFVELCDEVNKGFITVESCLTQLKKEVDELRKTTNQKLFNIEQIPGESAAIKLAAKDFVRYGLNYPIYSNQIVPLTKDVDLQKRIELTGKYENLYTGGGILHINLRETLSTKNQMKKLINYCVKMNCTHFAINYVFGMCDSDHLNICSNSDDNKCNICSKIITKKLTRIVGYFAPVQTWSLQRRNEFMERIFFGKFNVVRLE